MEKILAKEVVGYLFESEEMGITQFELKVVFDGENSIEKFHQWADNREHLGVFKISSSPDENYYLAFIDWRENDNYYVVVFDSNREGPLAELHNVQRVYDGLDLCWSYKPTKRDKKNELRKNYFKRYFGDTEVRIRMPQQAIEVDVFLQDLVLLVKNRVSADKLKSSFEYRQGFPEGRTLERLHKIKERSLKVTKLAKQNAKARFGKLLCEVCGFDFAEFYGDLGTDYIEAHHTIPVSELEEDHVTKVEDIALVCCNCHQMIHRRRPWLRSSELMEILNSQS